MRKDIQAVISVQFPLPTCEFPIVNNSEFPIPNSQFHDPYP